MARIPWRTRRDQDEFNEFVGIRYPKGTEWNQHATPAANTGATVTRAAPGSGFRHYITSISGSFTGGIPTEAIQMNLSNGAGTNFYLTACRERTAIVFPFPLELPEDSQASLFLAAGGVGISGRVTMAGYTLPT